MPFKSMFEKVLLFLSFLFLLFQFPENSFGQRKRTVAKKPRAVITVGTAKEISTDNLLPGQKRRMESFRQVWRIINDNYFDQTFNGLDWNKIKEDYEPKVLALRTDYELHNLLQELINRLNRSHFMIIPPEIAQVMEKAKIRARTIEEKAETEDLEEEADAEEVMESDFADKYGIGIDLRLIDNQFVITQIESDSAAEKSGLKTGFVLEKINGVSLGDVLKQIELYSGNAKDIRKQLPLEIIAWFLNSDEDSPVTLNYLDKENTLKEITVKREKIEGNSVKLLANFPRQFVSFSSKAINEETGYVKFNNFAVSTVEDFCSAISKFKDTKNLIIDLRGNMGGSFGSLMGIIGLLTDTPLKMGTEIYKQGKETRFIRPHKKNYKGKIIVLVDGLSLSAAEIFAAAMQENNRAVIIGEKSAGEALPAMTTTLETGATFLFPVANFETPKGNLLEGKGVEPDINVALDRQSLLAGSDKQLETALDFAKGKISLKPKEQARPKGEFIIAGDPTKPPPMPPPIAKKAVKSKTEFKQEAKALQIIDDFIKTIGGETALKNIKSYTAEGTAHINRAGASVPGELKIYRLAPDKSAEVMIFDGVGEVWEIIDGDEYFTRSQVMGTDKITKEEVKAEKKLASDFYEFPRIKELYPQITFLSTYKRNERMVHLIQGIAADGISMIFAFDTETKLLVHRTGIYTDVAYSDYRKVGDVLLPFGFSKGSFFNMKLETIKLNEKIDEKIFLQQESCFDRAN